MDRLMASFADAERRSIADFEEMARHNMAPQSFDFFFGAPGHPVWSTDQKNIRGFGHWELRPRVMRDTSHISLEVGLLGKHADRAD
jgi:isopentenyl diphosphate isomerase/L-lactate dehydrogenase-like FMN-dependent dehydrogenase